MTVEITPRQGLVMAVFSAPTFFFKKTVFSFFSFFFYPNLKAKGPC